jgi:hypothetical protein
MYANQRTVNRAGKWGTSLDVKYACHNDKYALLSQAMKISAGCWQSRFTRPVFVWALCAQLTEMTVEWLIKRSVVPAHSWITMLPVVPTLLFVVALVRAVQKMDELQRRICLESVFIAFVFTIALAVVIAGLDRAALYHPKFDDLGTPMMGFWACAYIFSAWRYR